MRNLHDASWCGPDIQLASGLNARLSWVLATKRTGPRICPQDESLTSGPRYSQPSYARRSTATRRRDRPAADGSAVAAVPGTERLRRDFVKHWSPPWAIGWSRTLWAGPRWAPCRSHFSELRMRRRTIPVRVTAGVTTRLSDHAKSPLEWVCRTARGDERRRRLTGTGKGIRATGFTACGERRIFHASPRLAPGHPPGDHGCRDIRFDGRCRWPPVR